ncbi:hypothetical protein [Jiangella mangrovi]|uniref:Uncharacterized protein n=1 Tax=Jiangella mangrovi TaxID=1524084 RepID=A0A7W9GMG9_9ACTN|nr:hypothetical protein [Jiangella mangrovi]MBB5786474.1 hypothetical protein [Jiangella mangrovi]
MASSVSPAVATSRPAYWAGVSPATSSTPSACAVAPGAMVSDDGVTVRSPGSTPGTSKASSTVTGSSLVFRKPAARRSGSAGPSSGCGTAPKASGPVVITTGPSSTRPTSTRPVPWSDTSSPSVGTAVDIRAALSSGPVSSGRACASSAAAPATCGDAMEVPESAT